jgi:hypothetical protein
MALVERPRRREPPNCWWEAPGTRINTGVGHPDAITPMLATCADDRCWAVLQGRE